MHGCWDVLAFCRYHNFLWRTNWKCKIVDFHNNMIDKKLFKNLLFSYFSRNLVFRTAKYVTWYLFTVQDIALFWNFAKWNFKDVFCDFLNCRHDSSPRIFCLLLILIFNSHKHWIELLLVTTIFLYAIFALVLLVGGLASVSVTSGKVLENAKRYALTKTLSQQRYPRLMFIRGCSCIKVKFWDLNCVDKITTLN